MKKTLLVAAVAVALVAPATAKTTRHHSHVAPQQAREARVPVVSTVVESTFRFVGGIVGGTLTYAANLARSPLELVQPR